MLCKYCQSPFSEQVVSQGQILSQQEGRWMGRWVGRAPWLEQYKPLSQSVALGSLWESCRQWLRLLHPLFLHWPCNSLDCLSEPAGLQRGPLTMASGGPRQSTFFPDMFMILLANTASLRGVVVKEEE